MKRLTISRTICLLMLGSLVAVTSCKKSKDDTPQPTINGSATASVNDVDNKNTFSFSADPTATGAILIKDTSLTVGLTDMQTRTAIILTIGSDNYTPATGTFTLSEQSDPHGYAILDLNGSTMADALYETEGTDGSGNSGSGTLTIISLSSNEVKGTFSITLYNYQQKKIVVSDGKFDCPLVSK